MQVLTFDVQRQQKAEGCAREPHLGWTVREGVETIVCRMRRRRSAIVNEKDAEEEGRRNSLILQAGG